MAVACAIATDPNLLLADELTGNLDAAAQEVLTIFAGLSPDFRKTIVAVTYDPHAASLASLRLHLEKGCLAPGSASDVHQERSAAASTLGTPMANQASRLA